MLVIKNFFSQDREFFEFQSMQSTVFQGRRRIRKKVPFGARPSSKMTMRVPKRTCPPTHTITKKGASGLNKLTLPRISNARYHTKGSGKFCDKCSRLIL